MRVCVNAAIIAILGCASSTAQAQAYEGGASFEMKGIDVFASDGPGSAGDGDSGSGGNSAGKEGGSNQGSGGNSPAGGGNAGASGGGGNFNGFGGFDRPMEGGRSAEQGGDRSPAGPAFRGPTVTVTLGGSTFQVQPATAIRFAELIAEHEQTTAWGNFASTAAAIFTLFGLLEPPNNVAVLTQTLERVRNGTMSAQELADKLSAPGIMANALNVKMINALMYEELDARRRGDREGAKLFSRLRDILQNPSRYRDGGIEYQNGKMIMRNPAAESWRDVPAFTLSETDWNSTVAFLRDISQHPGHAGILADGDLYWDAVLMKPQSTASMRDVILISTTLNSMSAPMRSVIRERLIATSTLPGSTGAYWRFLAGLTADPEAWRRHSAAMLYPDPVEESLPVVEDMPQIAEMYRW